MQEKFRKDGRRFPKSRILYYKMKSKFSTAWTGSKQPRKQRKYAMNAPLHIKHKFLSAHLSKELRAKHNKRSIPVRKGDEVLVMRGSFSKKKAKISEVNLKKGIVFIEGLQRTKKDGSKVNVPFYPSNLLIQTLNLDDKRRLGIVEKKENKEVKEVKKEIKAEAKK